MGTENKYDVVDQFATDRCQGNCKRRGRIEGQCTLRAMPGQRYCKFCIGVTSDRTIKDKELRNYRLGIFQQRVEELSSGDGLKTLNEEIGILRLTLENALDRCQTKEQLDLNSGRITDLVLKVEKLVNSCHRIELQTGMLLNKSQVIIIAGRLVSIVESYLMNNSSIPQDVAISIFESVAKDTIKMIEEVSKLKDDETN